VGTIKQRLMFITGYLGAVIGHGFASGQEIVQFFVTFHGEGFKGVFLATILFALRGAFLVYPAHSQRTSNYQSRLKYLLGSKMGAVIDVLMTGFLFPGIGTVLSASGAVFYEHLYLFKELGILEA